MLGSKTDKWMFLSFVVLSLCKDEEQAVNSAESLVPPSLFLCYFPC